MTDTITPEASSQDANHEEAIETIRRVLTGFAHLVCRDSEMNHWVFRGVSNITYRLFPSVARHARALQLTSLAEIIALEEKAYSKFRHRGLQRVGPDGIVVIREAITILQHRMAEAVQKSPLGMQGDIYMWTGLMQHVGVPTRLLDWSESPWIALYFASVLDADNDGAVYAFDKTELGKRLSSRELALVPLLVNIPRPAQSLIQAVEIPYAFDRIENQRGLFTVAEDPTLDHAQLLARAIPDRVLRWRIPAKCKRDILRLLASMNVEPRVLFPELKSLADSVRGELS